MLPSASKRKQQFHGSWMDSIFLTLALNPWTNRWSKQVQQWNLVSKKSRDFDECWEGENGESYPKGEMECRERNESPGSG